MSFPKMRFKVLLVVKTMSHYHHARLLSMKEFLGKREFDIKILAIANTQKGYDWATADLQSDENSVECLYKDNILEELSSLRCAISMLKKMRKENADVVVFSNYSYMPKIFAAIVNRYVYRKGNVVISDSTYEDRPRIWLKEWFKKILIVPFHAGIVAGRRSRQYMLGLGCSNNELFDPIDVVDNKSIGLLYDTSNVPESRSCIVCVARLIPEKNLFTLLDAYVIYLNDENGFEKCGLVICGDGPLKDDLLKYVNELEIQKNVTFTGYVGQNEVVGYLRQSFCSVLPSVSETWGLVVNESLAAGIPVVVSEKVGCVPELVIQGETGCIVDPYCPHAIASGFAMFERKSDVELREIAERCRKHISKWDLDDFANAVYEASRFCISKTTRG